MYSTPGSVFSITIGTSPRHDVFADVAFGRACIDLLEVESARCAVEVLAYCLMPDHVHLLLRLGEKASLPAFVRGWKSRCYGESLRRGQLTSFWQRSFYDHALRKEEDLRQVALYILANPVRRGLAMDFRDYPLCGSLAFDLAGHPP